jgi:hypothetical protein
MPLSREHESIVAISAFQTVGLVRQIFEELVEDVPREAALRAANR